MSFAYKCLFCVGVVVCVVVTCFCCFVVWGVAVLFGLCLCVCVCLFVFWIVGVVFAFVGVLFECASFLFKLSCDCCCFCSYV